jgi:hypothetical protein
MALRFKYALLPAVALAAAPALAHHSYGMFDMQKTATVDGTVKSFQWTNPHIWVDVTAANGATVSIEGDAIALMQRKGWSRAAMKPGDKIRVAYHPLKSGQPGGSMISAAVNGAEIGNGGGMRPPQ